jgi:hypothetical protein
MRTDLSAGRQIGPNLVRAAQAGRPADQDDLCEAGSSVSGRPAHRARIWFGLRITGDVNASGTAESGSAQVPNLLRAAEAGRPIAEDDLCEAGSSVSGRPAHSARIWFGLRITGAVTAPGTAEPGSLFEPGSRVFSKARSRSKLWNLVQTPNQVPGEWRGRPSSAMTPDKSSPSGPGATPFMSARSMVKLDTNAGKPSLTPLH